jgi:hypothetical protein
MTYRPSDIKKLEGSQTGPEPMFGMFKNESENGDIENCKHWSTLLSEELSSAVENDVMNTKDEASSFPEEVGVVIGMDHGQKAMRGYAKFLLTCPQRIVKHTVAEKLVESIEYLKQNQLVIVSNVTHDVVQALYVPKGATKFRIDADYRLEYDH